MVQVVQGLAGILGEEAEEVGRCEFGVATCKARAPRSKMIQDDPRWVMNGDEWW